MHHRIVDRSVLIYDHEADTNYAAICGVFLYGDTGFMHSMNGPRFYTYMSVHGRKVMDDLGVTRLEGYCKPSHVRLMRIALRRIGEVVVARTGRMAGQDMAWVEVTKRSIVRDILEAHDPSETLEFLTAELSE